MNPETIQAITNTIEKGMVATANQLRGEALYDIILTGVFILLCGILTFFCFQLGKKAKGADYDSHDENFNIGACIVTGVLAFICACASFAYVANLSKAVSTLQNPQGAAVRVLFENKTAK